MANLGKYEILDEIGKGGFGTVYRAQDTVLDRPVALKVLKPAWLDDREAVSRFYREARAAAKLNHPNIVRIHDMGEVDGRLFIDMELVDGEPLDQFIEQHGHLTLEQALPIIEDTANALAFAHAHGLIHRDVKPGNILIRKDGRALLTDFGLVRGNEQATIISFRSTGNALGTPEYIAPELWEESPPSAASDTYSLACVIYQMLTGKVLHAATSTPAVMRKHFAPADLSQVANERARAALANALTIDPANRAGMDALVAGLKDAAKPVVISVAPPPPPQPDPVAEARERANELFLKGHWSEAGAATKAWLALAPSDTNAQILLNKLTPKLQDEDVAQRVAQAKDRAKAMFAEGKWEEAINAAKSWLALAPDDPMALGILRSSEKILEEEISQNAALNETFQSTITPSSKLENTHSDTNPDPIWSFRQRFIITLIGWACLEFLWWYVFLLAISHTGGIASFPGGFLIYLSFVIGLSVSQWLLVKRWSVDFKWVWMSSLIHGFLLLSSSLISYTSFGNYAYLSIINTIYVGLIGISGGFAKSLMNSYGLPFKIKSQIFITPILLISFDVIRHLWISNYVFYVFIFMNFILAFAFAYSEWKYSLSKSNLKSS